jgi:hypothetical protein
MYIGILLGAHPILHISRIRVNGECLKITEVFADIGLLNCVNCR